METALATVTSQQIDDYLVSFGLADKLDPKERKQFVEVAMAFNLNPFKREIYCIPYGKGEKRKLSIITGYETYLKRAERTRRLTGWRAWTEGAFRVESHKKNGYNGTYEVRVPVGDLKAIVEIHIEGWKAPFLHEVYLDEYAQENDMWASKPRTMLKKVAIAQAFRLAFPDDMGGMPYTSDELPDEMTNVRNVTPESNGVDNHLQTLPSEDIKGQDVADRAWIEWKTNEYPAVRDGITEAARTLQYSKPKIKSLGDAMKKLMEARDKAGLIALHEELYAESQEFAAKQVQPEEAEEEIF